MPGWWFAFEIRSFDTVFCKHSHSWAWHVQARVCSRLCLRRLSSLLSSSSWTFSQRFSLQFVWIYLNPRSTFLVLSWEPHPLAAASFLCKSTLTFLVAKSGVLRGAVRGGDTEQHVWLLTHGHFQQSTPPPALSLYSLDVCEETAWRYFLEAQKDAVCCWSADKSL